MCDGGGVTRHPAVHPGIIQDRLPYVPVRLQSHIRSDGIVHMHSLEHPFANGRAKVVRRAAPELP